MSFVPVYMYAFAHAARLIISVINLAVFLREVKRNYPSPSSGIGILEVKPLRQGMPANSFKGLRNGLACQCEANKDHYVASQKYQMYPLCFLGSFSQWSQYRDLGIIKLQGLFR